jgi:hypothetical protein
VLGALHGPLAALGDWVVWQALPPPMGLLYLLSAALFVSHAWPRVVPFRALPPPPRGQQP